ncbi:glycosyltransferase family 4 protein [Thiorhodovibrio frisius]|uniref:Glycosyltransferase n=1 Tax=Thiorhodovibrio frisius TaxID=631362 RepID=H8Z1S9_9GAMM|nr:glycosyltransferase family 1 protein [Thiorhodovibrio frisius]EIC22557.1 glycosyltransferase [Thiorhodovibrio frisius]WPL19998.1 GDP-mannose-dependent alpha-(1-2)-phosphatidylinositol mannosyltransferase [Thiorhodovibrio frisius]
MKVILSVDPIKFPLTGIGRYTDELAKGLQRAELEGLRFLRGTKLVSSVPALHPAKAMASMPAWLRLAQKSRLTVAAYRGLGAWRKARSLRGFEDHLFHGPNYYLPPFAGRSVVTIHDLSPYQWPQCHPPERVRFMRAEIERSLERATALITDAEHTRLEVARYFGWPMEKIHAIPLASSPDFRPRSEQPGKDFARLLSALDIKPDQYTLFTGTIEPRKNLGVLLDAYSRLPDATRQRWPLVIIGYRGWGSAQLHARLQDAQRAGWLRYLGYLPQESLVAIMAGARLFVYPSLYEGFGLPVLEAMASGVPVVCSNASTLPEVAGDAAAYHAPNDTDALRDLILSGLEDEQWRAAARDAGLKQAGAFSWHRCVKSTIAVYRQVASES